MSGSHVIVVGYRGGGPAATQTATMNDDAYVVILPLQVDLFAAFTAKVEIDLGRKKGDTFEVKANFTLGADSNGIDPVHEAVVLEIEGGTGAFSTTIPAGSFKRTGRDTGSSRGRSTASNWKQRSPRLVAIDSSSRPKASTRISTVSQSP